MDTNNVMKELSPKEAALIENYRNLLDEFQEVADKNIQDLFDLQSNVMRKLLLSAGE